MEYLKSDTWSKASLDGVETHPVNVSPAPIESGLYPGPRTLPTIKIVYDQYFGIVYWGVNRVYEYIFSIIYKKNVQIVF